MADSINQADVVALNAARDAAVKSGGDPNAGNLTNLSTFTASRTAPTTRVNPDTIVIPQTTANPGGGGTFEDYRTKTALSPAELASINDASTARAKSLVDVIDTEFTKRTATQTDANASQDARTRVLNARTGNTDSGTGSAAISATEKKGKDALDALDHEHSVAVEAALGQVDQLRQSQVQAETAKKANDLVAYNNLRSTNATKAESTLEALAKAGTDLDKLKSDKDPNTPDGPSSYDTLATELGLSPLELELKFNALKKTDQKVDYTFKTSGDNVFGYGVDPATGKIKTIEETIPGLGTGKYTLKETKDGALYKVDADTGAVSPIRGATSTAPKSATFTFSKAQQSKLVGFGFVPAAIQNLQTYLQTKSVDEAIADLKTRNPNITDAQVKEIKSVLTAQKDTSTDDGTSLYGDTSST